MNFPLATFPLEQFPPITFLFSFFCFSLVSIPGLCDPHHCMTFLFVNLNRPFLSSSFFLLICYPRRTSGLPCPASPPLDSIEVCPFFPIPCFFYHRSPNSSLCPFPLLDFVRYFLRVCVFYSPVFGNVRQFPSVFQEVPSCAFSV